MKLSMKRIRLLLIILLSGVMITGCNVAEDLTDCDVELELAFRFMKGGTDQFGAEVSSLDVFIFDDQGQFIRRLVETDRSKFDENYRMRITLPPGQYNFITWGGLNSTQYSYPMSASQFQGATFTDEMEAATSKVIDRGGIVDYHPSDMFYGNRLDVVLVMERRKETILTDLVKNSTRINLKATGLPLPTRANVFTNLDFSFYAANGSYDYYNHISHVNPGTTLKYNALDESSDANDIYYSSFYTFRLVFDEDNSLVIWDKENNKSFYTGDVLDEFIRKDSRYDTQAKVDAEDVFNIELSFHGYTLVSVKLNGWDVQISNPGPIY